MFALALSLLLPAWAVPSARCTVCLEGGDGSQGLLYRESAAEDLELEWRGDWPELGRDTLRLYLGNPALGAALADRGLLTPVGGRARVRVPAREVGQGTLIAVIVRESAGGRAEEIVRWEVFRLLDPETHAAQLRGPAPHAGWELDLTPSVLRATRAGQALPRAQGEAVVWWSLVGQPLEDLDLDGASTGLPGLGVTVSQPWLRGEQPLREAVQALLGQSAAHEVSYGALRWAEQADVPVDDSGRQKIQYYYAVVTLHTNAGFHRYEGAELLQGLRPGQWGYFSHETSANLDSPEDPRLWSGYSGRELGEDPALLTLLARQVREGRPVPGLPAGLGRADGDGGAPSFALGLTARIQRWEDVVGQSPTAKAVIRAVDVVAARHGIALPRMEGAEAGPVRAVLERWLGGGAVDVTELPRGWTLALPVAEPSTRVGALQLQRGKPELAQRLGLALPVGALFPVEAAVQQAVAHATQAPAPEGRPAEPEGLESQTRFVLSADLRAGALVRDGLLAGQKRDLVPINTYAQYVVQIAVLLEDELRVAQANVDGDPGAGAVIPALPENPSALDRVASGVGVPRVVLLGAGAVVLLIVVLVLLHQTGLGQVFSRIALLVLPKPRRDRDPPPGSSP